MQGWSWDGFYEYLFNLYLLEGIITTLALTVAALRTGGSGRSEDARSRRALLRLPQSARILGMSCLANSVVRWLT